ncbi:MAG: DUF4363 family protein [Oscillospiraceae bacterium]|jgi:hypothetical protein|nr:DUF4363 family protein [Oscillospiraceae bacterium]
MRRKVIILIVSLAMVVGLQWFASAYTRGVTGAAASALEEMERAVMDRDWEPARGMMAPLSRSWNESCEPLDWWISRVMIESVRASMRELEIALEVGDYYESRRLLAEIMDTLHDITRWDELSLSNVV